MAVRYQGGKAVPTAKSQINLQPAVRAMADASIHLQKQIQLAKSEGDAKYAAGLQAGWDLLDKARTKVNMTLMSAR